MEVKDLKPVSGGLSPDIDLKKYHNSSVQIEKIEILQVPSTFTPKGADGKNLQQWCMKISSVPLLTVGEGETKIEVRASELFNLIQDQKTGELKGYPTTKDANLVKFMADISAKNPQEIIGKSATVKAFEKEVGDGHRIYLKYKY